ncbi:DNA polymerase III subunit gamma/tau [Candidatus Phytoplasma ziziphi]|nr:DNA polymerase III subunit gamma/tau [Candidatus Phytoplasma ziziphi]
MNYQALYRKHRPKNLKNIVGQNIIIQVLKNAIKYQKIHHCYLFSGDKGIGKTTLAKVFSKAINCSCFLAKEDCCANNNKDVCKSCAAIDQQATLDVVEIDGASYSGVDDIRELKKQLHYKSNLLKYKIYIIDEIHVLSSNAFNALLQILEEPSSNVVVFILITSEFNKIPKNILSRAQHFRLNNISYEDIQNRLKLIVSIENINISEEALQKISFYSNGSLRDSINLLDQVRSYKNDIIEEKDIVEILSIISEKKIAKLFHLLFQNDVKILISFLQEILESNINYVLFLNDFINFAFKKIINCYENPEENFHFLKKLNFQTKEKFFQKLSESQNNLKSSEHKKYLLIICFIQIHDLLTTQINVPKIENLNKINNNSLIKTKDTNFKKELFPKNNYNYNNIEKKEKTFKQAFLNDIINILISPNNEEINLICKGWKKLENYPIPKLAGIARLLYQSKALLINFNKEFLLSCENEEDYKILLKNDSRIQIEQILNAKRKLINKYFVILNKDWEKIIKPVYLKFLETKNKEDLNLNSFETDFYEKNSTLKLNEGIFIEKAKELFTSEKVKIIHE